MPQFNISKNKMFKFFFSDLELMNSLFHLNQYVVEKLLHHQKGDRKQDIRNDSLLAMIPKVRLFSNLNWNKQLRHQLIDFYHFSNLIPYNCTNHSQAPNNQCERRKGLAQTMPQCDRFGIRFPHLPWECGGRLRSPYSSLSSFNVK